MLCMWMDMDFTSTEDGLLFKEQLNDHLFKNNKEQGQGLENESKELEVKTQVDTGEELARSLDLPVDATNERLQPPATTSNSVGSLSPSEKADNQEQRMTDESDFQNDVQGSNFVHSTEALTPKAEDYECHTEKQEPNDGGELFCSSVNETSTVGMVVGDSDPYFSRSNLECTKSVFSDGLNGESYRISVNCSSDMANHNDNDIDCGNIVHKCKPKVDYQMVGAVSSDNCLVVRKNCVVHSPEKETSVLPEKELSNLYNRSPETESCARQDQLPPEVEEGKPSSPPKQISSPKMEWGRSRSESPARCLNGATSLSQHRQTSSTLKRSPETKSRQDEVSLEKNNHRAAHSRKHTPSPDRRIAGKKRVSSNERLTPSVRRKSSSGRTINENAHRRDHSPKKHLSSSPRRRASPRKRGKSVSQSPVRRKDSSTNRKDHKGRCRSRSPNARDHHGGSSRRRLSPRRRSPPSSSHSRHRSPRRPWSPPPNCNTGVGRPGRNLFVAGFSYATTERDLEKKFSSFGHVRGVRIVRDKRSGESRGFGFVSLERDEEADAAIRAVDRTEWNGRIVLVEKSKTPAR